MTYLDFHLIFTLPPIVGLTLVLVWWRSAAWLAHRAKAIGFLMVIAVIYTTPWDNYLVYKEVWSYGRDRVLGTIGFVPVEEYAFFILQTALTGLMLLVVGEWKPLRAPVNRPARRLWVAVFLVLALLLGAIGLDESSTLYMGLILVWAVPVILFLWLLGAEAIVQGARRWLPVLILSTVYLGAADRYAIGSDTWSISKEVTTGFHIIGLPLEEGLFFLVTNIMVLWGILLYEHFRQPKAVAS